MSHVSLNPSGTGSASGFHASSSGALDSSTISLDSGVRPSISLLPGTLVVEGTDGSADNPFEIVLNNA